jgi:hypothetical protein
VRDDHAIREFLCQGRKSVVTDRSFDRHLERSQALQKPSQFSHLTAQDPLPPHNLHFPLNYHHHAQTDTLLVEVRTDEFHGEIPFVEKLEVRTTTNDLPRF